jgi:1-acyl-sn-glycerol-3-phosphate acyltransferase
MNTTLIACALRHYLWRTGCALSGGLTVSGRWQHRGGCVLVANHGSHADTAAIIAALPPAAQPVFAAASDYWFDVPVRRFLVTGLAGALPVRRAEGGTYAALLAAAKPALAQGRTVVIYPEGTRTTDGTIGEFRSGAVHLARECGVPVVPVALLGTQQLLPKHGAFSPTPIEARLGEPVDPHATTAAELRRRVVAMRDERPIRQRQSQIWSATARLVSSRYGLLMAFLWGVAEALSWPIIAEMALVVFAAAVPRRVMPWTAALAAGSVLGVLNTAWLASRGVLLPAPLTTTRMAATAYDQLAAGPSAMLQQAFSGIPVKVYARAAGQHHIGMWELAGWTLLERGARIAVVGLAIWGLSAALHPWLRRLYGVYLFAVSVVFTAALTALLAAWS